MIGGGLSSFSLDKNLQTRNYISLQEVRHSKGEIPLNSPDMRYTCLFYTLKYKPSMNKGFKHRPFLLLSDIFVNQSNVMRFKNYHDFLESAQRRPELAWIVENTIHSQELFDIAYANPGLAFPIPFDVVAYTKKVLAKEGTDFETGDKGVFLVTELKQADDARREMHRAMYNKKDVKI